MKTKTLGGFFLGSNLSVLIDNLCEIANIANKIMILMWEETQRLTVV